MCVYTSRAVNVFVLGYPSPVGGADTELWHVIRLWRSNGVNVTLLPTWGRRPKEQLRLDAVGARTFVVTENRDLGTVPGLKGSVIVSFCNAEFIRLAPELRRLGCRLVWVNCMTYVTEREFELHRRIGPFDAYVFQSLYQLTKLAPKYATLGAGQERLWLIRGAFSCDEFPFDVRGRTPAEPFVVGRIARPDPAKWSSDLWPIYESLRIPNRQGRVMAWSSALTAKCGAPPSWVQALPANAESSKEFLRSLHCHLAINGGAEENWPRAGLEAMACGVPVVTENAWGWQEMIEHGTTGFLGEPWRLGEYVRMLAEDESLRRRICQAAREKLESDLANPQAIWSAWRTLFNSL